MSKQTQRKRIFQGGLTMVILGAVLGVTGLVVAPAGAAGNDHQITICHANEGGDGYSAPNPSKWQITAPDGHGSHPDDIIPPFAAGSQGANSWDAYPGLNWDAEGRAQYAECAPCPEGQTHNELGICVIDDCVPTAENNQCVPCETGTPDGQGNCVSDCVPTAENNQCVPCPVGTPDGQGNCPVPCEPTPANNQCVPCPPGTNPDGQGNCPVPVVVNDACPTVDGIQADVSECPVTVQDNTVTPTPTPAAQPATQVAGVQTAQLPRTGSTTVPLAQLGFGLVLMGVGALLFGREQALTV